MSPLSPHCVDLLGKLSGERSRWEQQLAELDGQLGQLPAAALLLAAFVTYLPAHPEDVRDGVLPAWARWVCGLQAVARGLACVQAAVHDSLLQRFPLLTTCLSCPGFAWGPVMQTCLTDCSQVGLPGFSPMAFLSSEAQMLTWQGQGLPGDSLSAQNALAILHGVQTPFIIDPSSQVHAKP